jgi:hypothetical protein
MVLPCQCQWTTLWCEGEHMSAASSLSRRLRPIPLTGIQVQIVSGATRSCGDAASGAATVLAGSESRRVGLGSRPLYAHGHAGHLADSIGSTTSGTRLRVQCALHYHGPPRVGSPGRELQLRLGVCVLSAPWRAGDIHSRREWPFPKRGTGIRIRGRWVLGDAHRRGAGVSEPGPGLAGASSGPRLAQAPARPNPDEERGPPSSLERTRPGVHAPCVGDTRRCSPGRPGLPAARAG